VTSSDRRLPGTLLWLAGYAALIALVLWLLFSARQWALRELARPEVTDQWQAWRAAEEQRAADLDLPVKRRVPKSAEPPALAILRDSFTGVAISLIAIVTVFYGFIVVVVRGAIAGRTGAGNSR
jgi:hypothetical protein